MIGARRLARQAAFQAERQARPRRKPLQKTGAAPEQRPGPTPLAVRLRAKLVRQHRVAAGGNEHQATSIHQPRTTPAKIALRELEDLFYVHEKRAATAERKARLQAKTAEWRARRAAEERAA